MSLIFTDFQKCTWLRPTFFWKIWKYQSHPYVYWENFMKGFLSLIYKIIVQCYFLDKCIDYLFIDASEYIFPETTIVKSSQNFLISLKKAAMNALPADCRHNVGLYRVRVPLIGLIVSRQGKEVQPRNKIPLLKRYTSNRQKHLVSHTQSCACSFLLPSLAAGDLEPYTTLFKMEIVRDVNLSMYII